MRSNRYIDDGRFKECFFSDLSNMNDGVFEGCKFNVTDHLANNISNLIRLFDKIGDKLISNKNSIHFLYKKLLFLLKK